jgi:NADH:ubiquinone oxidoreductase subunit F (NADH-binding)
MNLIEPCGADKSVGAACSRDSDTHRGYKTLPQKRSFQSLTGITFWLADGSCGQCPPCLQGTVSLGRTLDIILQGEGLSEHLHALRAKSHWRQLKTLITTKYTKSTKKP